MSATIIPGWFSGYRKILQYWTLPVKPFLIAIQLSSLEQKGMACPSEPLPRSCRERAPAATGGFSQGAGPPTPGRDPTRGRVPGVGVDPARCRRRSPPASRAPPQVQQVGGQAGSATRCGRWGRGPWPRRLRTTCTLAWRGRQAGG